MPDFNRLAKTLLWGGVLLALCCLFARLLARAKPFGDRAPRSIAAAPRATAPQSIIGLPTGSMAQNCVRDAQDPVQYRDGGAGREDPGSGEGVFP